MRILFILGLISNIILQQPETSVGQHKLSLTGSRPHIYLCINTVNKQVKDFQQANSIGDVKLIGGADISSGNILDLNIITLGKAIRKAFPDSLMQGLGALDWEGSELRILRNGNVSDPQFKSAIAKMVSVLDFARKIRPNVSWGYYGLPFREYWNRNSSWRENGMKLIPILKKADVLFPSVYLLYPVKSLKNKESSDYTRDNVNQALSLGEKLNKPVLPFIYHRYPDFKQIPVDVLKMQTDQILSENAGGKKVAGIVWWNADNYYYQSKNKVLIKEVGTSISSGGYYDALILNYSKELVNVVKNYQ